MERSLLLWILRIISLLTPSVFQLARLSAAADCRPHSPPFCRWADEPRDEQHGSVMQVVRSTGVISFCLPPPVPRRDGRAVRYNPPAERTTDRCLLNPNQ